jgi:hypothetical protein
MDKTEQLANLKKLLDDNTISESEFQHLKDDIINPNKKNNIKGKQINWYVVASLFIILILQFFCKITLKSEVEADVSTYHYGLKSKLVIPYFQTGLGITSMVITLTCLVLSFLRISFQWVGGVVISALLVATFNLKNFGHSYSNSMGGASSSIRSDIIYSPVYFYILFFVLLLILFDLGTFLPKRTNQEPLSKRLKVFAIVGIVGASLKIIQESYGFLNLMSKGVVDEMTTQYNSYIQILFSELTVHQAPTYAKDPVLVAYWSAIIGLNLIVFPILVLISQILILRGKKIFIYVFLLPWILGVGFKLFIQKDFLAFGSPYYGYVMDFMSDFNGDAKNLHLWGSIILFYLLPIVFFIFYFSERRKMNAF